MAKVCEKICWKSTLKQKFSKIPYNDNRNVLKAAENKFMKLIYNLNSRKMHIMCFLANLCQKKKATEEVGLRQ